MIWKCIVLIMILGLIPIQLLPDPDTNTEKDGQFPVLKGDYLGQKKPGLRVELFADGIVSTDKEELNSVFSPDHSEFYFSIDEKEVYRMMVMRRIKGVWQKPEIMKISGTYNDVDMFLSKDGQDFYFCSGRPLKNGITPKGFRIWVMKRMGKTWGNPEILGDRINFGKSQVYPSIDNAGTFYFQSRPGEYGKFDIYRSVYKNGAYQNAENLGPNINTKYSEGDAFIAPDGSYLIVTSKGRPDSIGDADLYISFRDPNNRWSRLKNMGPRINSKSVEHCPILSPDGKYLFFTSNRRGNRDIYWVDQRIIRTLKSSDRHPFQG